LGTGFYFAFKLRGGHEKIEWRDKAAVYGGKALPQDISFKAVVADILMDEGAVFLFDETVVIFLAVS
jgi:hypothetical protein